MFINATLLVQMIHFALAYFVLDRFLLNNVVRDIQQEQKNYVELLAHIESEKKKLRDQEAQKKTLWQALRTMFMGYTPENTFVFYKQKELPKKNIQTMPITKELRQRYQKDLETFLYTKVKNVR